MSQLPQLPTPPESGTRRPSARPAAAVGAVVAALGIASAAALTSAALGAAALVLAAASAMAWLVLGRRPAAVDPGPSRLDDPRLETIVSGVETRLRTGGSARPVLLRLALLPLRRGHGDARARVPDAERAWGRLLEDDDALVHVDGTAFLLLLAADPPRIPNVVADRLRAASPAGTATSVQVVAWDGFESATELVARAASAQSAAASAEQLLADPKRLAALAATPGLAARQDAFHNEIAAGLAAQLQVPMISIALYDAGEQHIIGGFGAPDGFDPDAPIPAQAATCFQTATTGAVMLVSQTAGDPAVMGSAVVEALDVHACAAVPVRAPCGAVLGSVCALQRTERTWSADDVRHLTLAARQIAARLQAVDAQYADHQPIAVADARGGTIAA